MEAVVATLSGLDEGETSALRRLLDRGAFLQVTQIANFMYTLLFILLCLIWSSHFILMKKAGLVFGPVTVGGMGAVGGALTIAIFWKLRRTDWGFKREHIALLAFLIVFCNIYPFAVQPFLINKIGHGFIGMLTCLAPIFTILISIPILKIFPGKLQLMGVFGGLAGIVAIMSDGLNRNISFMHLLLGVSVPFIYSLGNVIVNRYFKEVSAVSLSLATVGFSGMALLPAGLFLERMNMEGDLYTATFAVLLLGILSQGAGNVIFFDIIKKKGPLFAGMITYILVPGTLAWSWIDNETITMAQVAAIVFILFMVRLAQSDEGKPRR